MKRFWLAAQVGVLLGVGLWIASSAGCGAKSSLRIEEEEPADPDDPPPPPPVECDDHSECDDGEYCNGTEACIDGFCESGDIVDCGIGDDCHMIYCDEERDRCVEMLMAEDNDGDGFFGAPCGEDCDDADADVYPGAREICNGVDDDCDGEVDEDLVQECEDFGRRNCVDGEWTDCMTCTICIPGAFRYCDTPSYCSWGGQFCNDAGDGWSSCDETSPPPGCTGYIYDMECCLSSGACCQDWTDTDRDGDYDDTVGACEDVICPGAD